MRLLFWFFGVFGVVVYCGDGGQRAKLSWWMYFCGLCTVVYMVFVVHLVGFFVIVMS